MKTPLVFLVLSLAQLNLFCLPRGMAAEPILIDETPARLMGVESRFWSTAFSPDGKSLLVTAGNENPDEPGELTIWDVPKWTPKLIRRQEKTIRTAAYSPDGTRVATGDFAGIVRMIDPHTGQILSTLPPHSKLVNSVTFSADGKILFVGSFDGQVTLWDVGQEKEQHTFSVGDDAVVSLAAASDDRHLAAVTWHGKVHLWDYPSRQKRYELRVTKGLPNGPAIAEAIAFAPDGKTFVTGCWDTALSIRQTRNGKVLRELLGQEAAIHNAAYSPSGKFLVTSDMQGIVAVWDPDNGNLLEALDAHQDRCFGLSFSRDGKRLATVGWDHAARIWDTETWKEVEKPKSP